MGRNLVKSVKIPGSPCFYMPSKHLFTQHLLFFSSSYDLPSFPLKSQTNAPFSLAQIDMYTSLGLTLFGTSHVGPGSPYVYN